MAGNQKRNPRTNSRGDASTEPDPRANKRELESLSDIEDVKTVAKKGKTLGEDPLPKSKDTTEAGRTAAELLANAPEDIDWGEFVAGLSDSDSEVDLSETDNKSKATLKNDRDTDQELSEDEGRKEWFDDNKKTKEYFEALPSDRLPKKIKTWEDGKNALPHIASIEELHQWCTNEIFRRPMRVLLRNYIWPLQQTSSRTRGEDFSTVMAVIEDDEMTGKMELTSDDVDRSAWKRKKWEASTLLKIHERNKRNIDGLFRGQNMPESRQYALLFSIMRLFLKECATTRIARIWKLLCFTEEEEAEVRQNFPHIDSALAKTKDQAKITRKNQREVKRIMGATFQALPIVQKKAIRQKARANKPKVEKKNPTAEPPVTVEPTPSGESRWRNELSRGRGLIELHQKSPTFDISDPWWQSWMITTVLDEVDQILARDTTVVDYDPSKPPDDFVPPITSKVTTEKVPTAITTPTTTTDGLTLVQQVAEATEQGTLEDIEKSTNQWAIFQGLNGFLKEGPTWNKELEKAAEAAVAATATVAKKKNTDQGKKNVDQNTTDDGNKSDALNTPVRAAMAAATVDISHVDTELLNQIDSMGDNVKLQRENVEEARIALNATRSGDVFKIPHLRANISLRDWQLVGVFAAVEAFKDPTLTGHINADDVGLGKTWITIGFLLSMATSFKGPILIVVPAHLVFQFKNEITRGTDFFKIHILYGDHRDSKHNVGDQVIHQVRNDHPMFTDETPGRHIEAQHRWQDSQKKKRTDTLDRDWPKCLEGRFGCVVYDEVHTIRNAGTSLFKTVSWLKGHFNLLLSATPLFNSIDDIKTMLTLLLNPANDSWWDDVELDGEYNPLFDKDRKDPNYRLLYTPTGLDKWVWHNHELSTAGKARAVLPIWEKCCVRRLVTSKIPFNSDNQIGKDIPPVLRKVVDVQFTGIEQTLYNNLAYRPRKSLVSRTKEGGRPVWRSDFYRLLTLLGTWLGAPHVQNKMMSEDIERMASQLNEKGTLGKILTFKSLTRTQKQLQRKIQEANKNDQPTKHLVEAIHKLPGSAHDLDRATALAYLLIGAPKLRAWLRNVHNEIFVHGEKSVTWTSNPAQQFLAAAVLNLCGIRVGCYHRFLTPHQRERLVHDFNENPEGIQCMINSYLIGSSGTNFQKGGRNVHLLSLPFAISVLTQALGRTRRLGQTNLVLVYEYRLNKSFDLKQLNNNMKKAVVGLAMQLNSDTWTIQLVEDEDGATKIKLESPWVKNKDGTLSPIPLGFEDYINPHSFISPEHLLFILLEAQTSSSNCLRDDGPADVIKEFLMNPAVSIDNAFDPLSIWKLDEVTIRETLQNYYKKFSTDELDVEMKDPADDKEMVEDDATFELDVEMGEDA